MIFHVGLGENLVGPNDAELLMRASGQVIGLLGRHDAPGWVPPPDVSPWRTHLWTGPLCLLALGWACADGPAPEPEPSPETIPSTQAAAEEPAGEAEFARAREAMVRRQIEARGVTDARVLAALRAVPRHRFVPPHLERRAYDDGPLPIGHDQTISQPYIVALMTELLALKPGEKVLEIGTGSGYQAAVLAEIVDAVYSIEILRPLGEDARRRLRALGYDKVEVRIGDGYLGWPEAAPFDGIIVTCAPDHVPAPLIEQLAVGGRMVIPVGPDWRSQELYLLTRQPDGTLRREAVLPVRFVPLVRGRD